jgi:hypothetical protein
MGEARYYHRLGADNPECLQDYATLIRIGDGQTRMYNLRVREWFVVTDEPSDAGQLGEVQEITEEVFLSYTEGLHGPATRWQRLWRRVSPPSNEPLPLRPPERTAVCSNVEEHLSHDRIHKPESKLARGLKWLFLLKWARPRMRVWEEPCPRRVRENW